MIGQCLGGGRRNVRWANKEEHLGLQEAEVGVRKLHGEGGGRGALLSLAPE